MKKILFIDIETAPNLAYVWGKWEQNVIAYKKEGYMISFAYKWAGDRQVKGYCLSDFPLYKKNRESDKALVTKLWGLIDEADIVIAHNGDQFDIRKANAYFIANGLGPTAPYKTVDTKKIAKRYFAFNSNKLDDLGEYLGLGRKMETGGFDLWLGCLAGNKKSWDIMLKYNKQDIVLLEKVYERLKPWATTHPHVNPVRVDEVCPTCGSDDVASKGRELLASGWKPCMKCKSCGRRFYGKLNKHAEKAN